MYSKGHLLYCEGALFCALVGEIGSFICGVIVVR